jgi:hypothetical protein
MWSNFQEGTQYKFFPWLTPDQIITSNSHPLWLIAHTLVSLAAVTVIGAYLIELELNDTVLQVMWSCFNALILINFWHLAILSKIMSTIVNIGLIMCMNNTTLPFTYILLLSPVIAEILLLLITKIF